MKTEGRFTRARSGVPTNASSIVILVSALQAEGTPILALDLARIWISAGLKVTIATFFAEPQEMRLEFEAMNIRIHCFNLNRNGSAKFFQLAWKVNALCRRLRPDAILCFPFGWHGYLHWAARAAGVRNLVAHAGNYPPSHSRLNTLKLAFAAWMSVPFRGRVSCCSDYVREGIHNRLCIPRKLLRTVYNGIDLSRFTSPQSYGDRKAGGRLRCGMVARLEGHKDQPTLIRAFKIVIDSGIEAELELAGEGSRRTEFTTLIQQLGLQNHIRLLGTRRDIPNLLRSWDLFLFSVTPDDGLGIALIEALAAGVPVIASDVGACREVLRPRNEPPFGTLVKPGCPQALAGAIISAVRSSDWNESASGAARDSVSARFSLEAMAAAYLSLLKIDEVPV